MLFILRRCVLTFESRAAGVFVCSHRHVGDRCNLNAKFTADSSQFAVYSPQLVCNSFSERPFAADDVKSQMIFHSAERPFAELFAFVWFEMIFS